MYVCVLTPKLQDQDRSVQDQDRFLGVSDRSCPKTDGLWPHHWLWHCCEGIQPVKNLAPAVLKGSLGERRIPTPGVLEWLSKQTPRIVAVGVSLSVLMDILQVNLG